MRKWLTSHWLVGSLLLLALLFVHRTEHPYLTRLQNQTFDLYQQLQPRQPDPSRMPARVAIIDIDEPSLKAIGQWPWSRTDLAMLVQKLTQFGVAVIGFDAVFPEHDRTSPTLIAAQRDDLPENLRRELKSLPSNENVFAQAIAQSRVVLGQVGVYQDTPGMQLKPKVGYGYLSDNPGQKIHPMLNRYLGLVQNLPELEEAAQGIGLFSTTPDADGAIRRVALVERIGDKTYPSLSLEMLRVALGGRDDYLIKGLNDGQPGIQSILVKTANPNMNFEIPTDASGRVYVHYARYKTAQRPLYISAADVIQADTPEEINTLRSLLQGALVLVGTSAVGLKDIRETPINPALPGVEVHAQLLETILSEAHLTRPDHVIMIEWAVILLSGIVMIVLVPRLSAAWVLLIAAATIGGVVFTAWHFYLDKRQLMDASYPVLSVAAMFLGLGYLNYLREERERRYIKSAFGHYVSPALLDELADNPEKLALGGETRNITILFSDIRGFTTISERFNAQELTRFINKYLTPMTNVIMDHKGTIDKYMGDAIMAFWNAPLPVENHPEQAARAALAMQKAVKELNATLLQDAKQESQNPQDTNRRHYMPITIGIGLNTGDCCVGNMGSDQRFDYSALGDDVNLASRLEGQSKTYGVDIVLGQNTVAALPSGLAVIELDLIQVKGKTEPVRVYALLGDETYAASDTFRHVKQHAENLLSHYRARRWDDAQAAALKLGQQETSLQTLADLYLSRIKEFRASPPGLEWNGVYVATQK